MIKMRPPWHREDCWECGCTGLATRGEPRPASEPYYCEGCEVWRKAAREIDRVELRANAYAWCTCLGWIATLQKTSERAYWCGVHDGPYDDARQLKNAPGVGAEQVHFAAQDAGLMPEDPGPFGISDIQPVVPGRVPTLGELEEVYDEELRSDETWLTGDPPKLYIMRSDPIATDGPEGTEFARQGPLLWGWMRAHPSECVDPAVDAVDGLVVSGFRWRWREGWECTGPHLAWHQSYPPSCHCVPVRGYWGDEI